MKKYRKKVIHCKDEHEYIIVQKHLVKEGYRWSSGRDIHVPEKFNNDNMMIFLWDDMSLTYSYGTVSVYEMNKTNKIEGIKASDYIQNSSIMNTSGISKMFDDII